MSVRGMGEVGVKEREKDWERGPCDRKGSGGRKGVWSKEVRKGKEGGGREEEKCSESNGEGGRKERRNNLKRKMGE